jgi:hypothetical protein
VGFSVVRVEDEVEFLAAGAADRDNSGLSEASPLGFFVLFAAQAIRSYHTGRLQPAPRSLAMLVTPALTVAPPQWMMPTWKPCC